MEKLIELLNEYHFFNTDCINYVLDEEENRIYLKEEFDGFYHEQRINAERIISKKFGFIKWLVENEKIDRSKFEIMSHSRLGEDEYFDEFFHCIMSKGKKEIREEYSDYESLLMLLSIQDEPINFLISILK